REVRRELRRVELELRLLRHLVRIVDAREPLEDARARLRIQTLAVARLANLERRRDVDLDEAAERLDHLAHDLARRGIGRDRRADRDAAVLGDLARDVADTLDVEIAVLLREPELARQVLAHEIAV